MQFESRRKAIILLSCLVGIVLITVLLLHSFYLPFPLHNYLSYQLNTTPSFLKDLSSSYSSWFGRKSGLKPYVKRNLIAELIITRAASPTPTPIASITSAATAQLPTATLIPPPTSSIIVPSSTLNDNLSKLLIGLSGVILGAFLNHYLTKIRNRPGDLSDLKNNLEKALLAKDWDTATAESTDWWNKDKSYRHAVNVCWEEFSHNNHRIQDIHNDVWMVVHTCLRKQKSHDQEEKQKLGRAIDNIYNKLESKNGFLFQMIRSAIRNNIIPRYVSSKIELIENTDNQFWLSLLKYYQKDEDTDNAKDAEKHLKDQIIPNIFRPVRCESDCLKAIEFLKNDEISDYLNYRNNISFLTGKKSSEIRNLLIECKRQGGRTSLGVWSTKTIITSGTDFPVFIRAKENWDLSKIETEIAYHLLHDIATRPENFLELQSDAQEWIAPLLIYVFSVYDKLKSELDILATDNKTEPGSIYRVHQLIMALATKKRWPKSERERINTLAKCLLKGYESIQLIIDFEDFRSNEEKDRFRHFCQLLLNEKQIRLLALLPEKVDFEFESIGFLHRLSYSQDALIEILINRLRQNGKTISDLWEILQRSIPREQFFAAAQGRPGLLFEKGTELLQEIHEKKGIFEINVTDIFYVPNQILGLNGSRQDMNSNSAKINSARAMQAINYFFDNNIKMKENWVKLKVVSEYKSNAGGSPELVFLLYEIEAKGGIRGQSKEIIKRAKEDIVKSKLGIKEIDLRNNSKGLLFILLAPELYEDQLIYVDRNFTYLLVLNFKTEYDKEKVIKQLQEFYDWDAYNWDEINKRHYG